MHASDQHLLLCGVLRGARKELQLSLRKTALVIIAIIKMMLLQPFMIINIVFESDDSLHLTKLSHDLKEI